jgi:hypothetical protein
MSTQKGKLMLLSYTSLKISAQVKAKVNCLWKMLGVSEMDCNGGVILA